MYIGEKDEVKNVGARCARKACTSIFFIKILLVKLLFTVNQIHEKGPIIFIWRQIDGVVIWIFILSKIDEAVTNEIKNLHFPQ